MYTPCQVKSSVATGSTCCWRRPGLSALRTRMRIHLSPAPCQHLPGEKRSSAPRCRDPSSSPHRPRLDQTHLPTQGSAGLNSGPRSGQGVPTSVPPQPSGKQEREAGCRVHQATGTVARSCPQRRRLRTQGDPTIARRKTCSPAGTRAPLPTTPAEAWRPPGQPREGTLTF